jgi:DNA invertase Pin-like site-specific DNA recombinase
MKYIVYYRVSTKHQGESGLGLEAQKSYIRLFLSEADIHAEVTEVKSAKNVFNRPVLMQAIELCKAKGFGLAVAKVDRLSRNTEQCLAIYNELKGLLFSCDIPMQKFSKMDKFQLTLLLAFAERERFLISERTKAGLKKSKKAKGWNIPKVREAIQKSEKLANSAIGEHQTTEANQNINSLQAIEKIRELLSQGMNSGQIAKELSKRNGKGEMIYKTPNYGKLKAGQKIDKDWQPIQVQRLVKRFGL